MPFYSSQRWKYATSPTVEWGPFLVKHREEVAKYTPGFVVDPWGGDSQHKIHEDVDELAYSVSNFVYSPAVIEE